jgi:alpha-tubulin suppressor-like RCC1 family protein
VRGFERLARGTYDTMCALADGRQRIYCWGLSGPSNASMIPAAPQDFQYVAPTPIPQGAIPPGSLIKKVAASTFNICALTDDGGVYCWGSNARGTLGVNTSEVGRLSPTQLAAGEVPAGVRFVDLAIAGYGGCAAGDDGRLYCWGDHNHIPNPALSGNGPSLAPMATVRGDVASDVKLIKAVVDSDQGCALGDNGRAYCWRTGSRTPSLVPQGAVPTNVKLIDLQLAGDLPCALADNGQIYCWGTSFGYRFGAGQSAYVSSAAPTAVVDGAKPAGVKFTAFTVGGIATASCAVAEDGALYCWGKGYLGSAGDGDASDHEIPSPVRVLAGEKEAAFRWTQINCSQYTCIGLASDRRIYSWGFNQNRMLSRESQTVRSATPLMVTRPTRP